jgi:hypothetical protein
MAERVARAATVMEAKPIKAVLTRIETRTGTLRCSQIVPHPTIPEAIRYVRVAQWELDVGSAADLETAIQEIVCEFQAKFDRMHGQRRLEWLFMPHPILVDVRYG